MKNLHHYNKVEKVLFELDSNDYETESRILKILENNITHNHTVKVIDNNYALVGDSSGFCKYTRKVYTLFNQQLLIIADYVQWQYSLINNYTGVWCDDVGSKYVLIEAVLYPNYLKIHKEVEAIRNLKSKPYCG
ncbi:hypothetical protein H1Q59_05565 [Holosporaceae bacterium 'Namur']|nr:hypothetical protein [Holosporaceae bacterium 'Namur']